MKATRQFDAIRARPERAAIRDERLEHVIREPARECTRADGRIRSWAQFDESGGRWPRVAPLADGETGRNAFLDRRFDP